MRTTQATHGVKIGRGTVTHWNGEPITSREMAGRVLRRIEELTGEQGVTTKILATLRMPGDMPRYFYDADAIREPAEWARWGDQTNPKHEGSESAAGWIKPKTKRELQGETDHRYEGLVGQTWKKPPTWEERKAAGASRGNVAFDGNVGTGTQRGVHGEGISHDLGDGLSRNARSVWPIQTRPYPDAHFAVFPEALPERCILAGCPEDGTVLDPFMGSGTTALVARRLGRKSVGVELNPEYAAMCARRLSQLSLLAEPGAAA